MGRTVVPPRFIYLAGADGAGKTTYARAVVARLQQQGVRCRYVWFRWPHMLSLPLLAYCRLRGLTRYRVIGGVRYGGWEFHRSRTVSALFPWLFLADTALAALAKVHLRRWRGITIVCDRFVYDALVDLMMAVKDDRLFTRPVGRLFLRLVPRDGTVVVLDADEDTLRQRKGDLKHDQRTSQRRALYFSLVNHLGLAVASTAGSAGPSADLVSSLLAQPVLRGDPGAAEEQRLYAVTGHPLLLPLLRRRAGALAVSWVFQGLLYMDRTERFFKLAIDGLITAAVGLPVGLLSPLGFGPALLGAFLIAHTANWLFNGQVFVVLKHFGVVRHTMAQWDQYVQALQDRIRDERSVAWAGAFGSLARGHFSETSDLDVRIVRHPGFLNALRACWFVMKERTRAFFSGYPLDIYVLDSERPLEKLRADEPALPLHKANAEISRLARGDRVPGIGAESRAH